MWDHGNMAVRKKDPWIPDLAAKDSVLAVACGVANASEDVRATELEFDAISTDFAEPWLAANDHPAYG